jgi:hypothetical protein
VMCRLQCLASVELEKYPDAWDPIWLVKNGMCDPVRTFVKNEPHKIAKIREGRLRLIFSSSMIDQMVEMLISTRQDEYEIDHYLENPSKPGFGVGTDEQVSEFWNYMKPKLKDRAESDVIGWDWQVKPWMTKLEARVRIRLGEFSQVLARICRNRFWCLSRTVIVLSDGRMFTRLKPGIWVSGCDMTSSSGSRMRIGLHCLIALDVNQIADADGDAMGDDCNERFLENAHQKYRDRGFPLKMYQPCVGPDGIKRFEFCSHEFRDGVAKPLNIKKSVYRLLMNKPDLELYRQWRYVYRHADDIERYDDIVVRVWLGPDKLV